MSATPCSSCRRPAYVDLVARQPVEDERLDRVHQLLRRARGRNEVVPAPRRVLPEQPGQLDGDRVRPVKVVEQPAVDAVDRERLLNCRESSGIRQYIVSSGWTMRRQFRMSRNVKHWSRAWRSSYISPFQSSGSAAVDRNTSRCHLPPPHGSMTSAATTSTRISANVRCSGSFSRWYASSSHTNDGIEQQRQEQIEAVVDDMQLADGALLRRVIDEVLLGAVRADVALERELARDDVLDGDLLVPAVAAVALVAARLGDFLRAAQRASNGFSRLCGPLRRLYRRLE